MAIIHPLIVLLVANEAANSIRKLLERLDAVERLTTVPDGEGAIAHLLGRGKYVDRMVWPLPSTIIIDQNLPGLSGLDLARWLRSERRWASLPTIVLADSLSPMECRRATRLQVACGPRQPEELAKALPEALTDAFHLVQPAWFASRAAYDGRDPAAHAEPIRVWT